MKYDIKDKKLAAAGKLRIEWAERFMPVLRLIRNDFKKQSVDESQRCSGLKNSVGEL